MGKIREGCGSSARVVYILYILKLRHRKGNSESPVTPLRARCIGPRGTWNMHQCSIAILIAISDHRARPINHRENARVVGIPSLGAAITSRAAVAIVRSDFGTRLSLSPRIIKNMRVFDARLPGALTSYFARFGTCGENVWVLRGYACPIGEIIRK